MGLTCTFKTTERQSNHRVASTSTDKQALYLILQNDSCRTLNCLSHTFSEQFPPRLWLCVRRASVLTMLAFVCVYVCERWSLRDNCKFSLAITLRRVMLRSAEAANQKLLMHLVLWMRWHVCEVHTLRVRILHSDVIQSHRSSSGCTTDAKSEQKDASSNHF